MFPCYSLNSSHSLLPCVHKPILYFCISITALQIGSWRADSSGRKERIKKKMLLLHKHHFLYPTLSPTRIWSLWGWYLLYKLFTGDSLVLNKYLPNEWMNDQILPLFVFSLRRQEPALLKIIQQVCFEGWLSTQVFWWKAHPLSTKTSQLTCKMTSLVAQIVKNLLAMQETWVQSLSWKDPIEKGIATHSSILVWRISWTVQSVGLQRVRQDSGTNTLP